MAKLVFVAKNSDKLRMVVKGKSDINSLFFVKFFSEEH